MALTSSNKSTIGIASIFTVLVIILIYLIKIIFFDYEEIPQINENNKFNEDRIEILRDNFGNKKIIAETQDDYYFSTGYLHAYDRLWQMEFYRRLAQGRLSIILGENYIKTDKIFKDLNFHYFFQIK